MRYFIQMHFHITGAFASRTIELPDFSTMRGLDLKEKTDRIQAELFNAWSLAHFECHGHDNCWCTTNQKDFWEFLFTWDSGRSIEVMITPIEEEARLRRIESRKAYIS